MNKILISKGSPVFKSDLKIKQDDSVTTCKMEQKPDSFESSTNEKPNKKKLALAIGAGLVAIGIAVKVIKGKIDANKILKEIPNDLKPIFKDIKAGAKGQNFIDESYQRLVKYFGLEDIAPAKVTLTDKTDGVMNAAQGGFSPIQNTIEFSQGFTKNLSPAQQVQVMAHELKHCRQFTDILLTEGGSEELAKAWAKSSINAYKESIDFAMVKGNMTQEQIDNYLKTLEEQYVDECLKKIKANFAKTLEKPKYSATSPEAQKAKQYLEAASNYEGLGFLGMGSEAYRNNLLEQEAYSFGDKVKQWATTFMQYGKSK